MNKVSTANILIRPLYNIPTYIFNVVKIVFSRAGKNTNNLTWADFYVGLYNQNLLDIDPCNILLITVDTISFKEDLSS